VSHRLSRRLNNATGQCPVVCPSHVDNDGTVARGVWTYRCPVVCPVVPSLFRPTGRCAFVFLYKVALSTEEEGVYQNTLLTSPTGAVAPANILDKKITSANMRFCQVMPTSTQAKSAQCRLCLAPH